ncbi:hypothetical protein Nans01_32610 [Nocardiopsis ansamitocini]|uniref:Uncharacterized protein n=1 Tax=Nocardiopsis ansamitocini TaxID=1670832 RepID=A0A9W6P7G6_9ACTN|nr:hypothetical protein Nans01_32610 [Nocardiopsis ansamitocini]
MGEAALPHGAHLRSFTIWPALDDEDGVGGIGERFWAVERVAVPKNGVCPGSGSDDTHPAGQVEDLGVGPGRRPERFHRRLAGRAQAEFLAATALGRTDEVNTRPDPYSCVLGDGERFRRLLARAPGPVAGRLGGTGSGGAAVPDRDAEIAGIAPRSVDARRADHMFGPHSRSSAVAS